MFWRKQGKGEHHAVVQATAGMVRNNDAHALAGRHGLSLVDLTWEDTARTKDSSLGPNISDMTIQVESTDPDGVIHHTCMPVMRLPNYTDVTGDVRLDEFWLLAGNEKGQPLRKIKLRDYLDDLRRHLTRPGAWPGDPRSLLAERDEHVLVSAQACFLPVSRAGEATFNVVLFNYQSRAGDPAVLTVLITREGTSATIIDNVRDGFTSGTSWGQRLFFNDAGERASLTGRRVSDVVAERHADAGARARATAEARAGGVNVVLLVQVPLRQREPASIEDIDYLYEDECAATGSLMPCSDIEDAVIGHGPVEGPFTEVDAPIERDERYPIRVTVQFYKATSDAAIREADVADIAGQLRRVYAMADEVGSLVVGGDSGRPTERS